MPLVAMLNPANPSWRLGTPPEALGPLGGFDEKGDSRDPELFSSYAFLVLWHAYADVLPRFDGRPSGLPCGLLLALVAVAWSGCSGLAAHGPVHSFDNDDGHEFGCLPQGELLTLRGTIVVRPFGKGNDGAVLRVNAREEWILSYGARGILLAFEGKRVEVRGRACVMQGEAISGNHLELATMVEVKRR